jgi:hypothetical protein
MFSRRLIRQKGRQTPFWKKTGRVGAITGKIREKDIERNYHVGMHQLQAQKLLYDKKQKEADRKG